MDNISNLVSVNDFCSRYNTTAAHPLVTVMDLSKLKRKSQKEIEAIRFNFYAVFLKQNQDCILRYGRKYYDFQQGTLVFAGPGQVVGIESSDDYVPSGHALLFHADLLHGTNLANDISKYSFFSYEVHEALHLSAREREIFLDCLEKIDFELNRDIDRYSKELIVANIDVLLRYCTRFYNRQFITREMVNTGVVDQFNTSLNQYLRDGKATELGYPTVSYFAEQQNLSPNYFGDLIKKETGRSALDLIHAKLIEIAKEQIFDPTRSISEIAYELGFKHPQHFSRLFKSKVGQSPLEFRMLN